MLLMTEPPLRTAPKRVWGLNRKGGRMFRIPG